MWWKEKWLSKDQWCLYKEWYEWEWMKDVFVGWAASCSICCCISLKRPRSDSVTVLVCYVDYTRWFRAYVLVLWSRSDHVIVRDSGASSMSAEAEYMRLDLLSHVLICLSLDWFERYECMCVCVVYNCCIFSLYSILWCIDYFTRFYNNMHSLAQLDFDPQLLYKFLH